MRKAFLLVVLFLGGMATQAIAQNHNGVKKGNKHRYYNTQEIRFVENGVLFTVSTDGTFSFKEANYGQPYSYKKRRNHNTNYYGVNHYNNKRRRGYRPINVKTDYYGNVVGVNNVCISYKRNGRVKQIGSIPLYWQRGTLMQIGGMSITYNRFGDIRNTHGYINRHNRKVWHNDWYTYNDHNNEYDDEVWEGRDRRRTR